jgi:hypothetical protein
VHGRSRRYEGTALYACLCGLEPIQSPECRAADTIPTPPYTHHYMHPYILTIRYKALPPKSPYTVPYAGFGWLISKFQVLRHSAVPGHPFFIPHATLSSIQMGFLIDCRQLCKSPSSTASLRLVRVGREMPSTRTRQRHPSRRSSALAGNPGRESFLRNDPSVRTHATVQL